MAVAARLWRISENLPRVTFDFGRTADTSLAADCADYTDYLCNPRNPRLNSNRCLLFIQIFVGNVVLRHLMRSNFSLIRVCGFYSTNHSGFERIAFLEQLGDAF